MASEQSTPPGTDKKCPVFFCGNPKASAGFEAFYSNVRKIAAIHSEQIPNLMHVTDKTKDLDHGIVVMLLSNKSDLVNALNSLMAFKKRTERGTIRILAYNLLESDKIASVLKSKGCSETFSEGMTQKALVHKLQKHIQIVNTKYKLQRKDVPAESAVVKSAAAKKAAADKVGAQNAKLKFVAALTDANDCWLVKNKKDFKYIRGNWIGELIGPGPSVGSWTEAGGTTAQTIYRWTPRNKTDEDPFVPGKGSWFFAGRKPEFDWKINRWRFVGETPSLFYRAPDAPPGAGAIFRFRSAAVASLDVALNSVAAKGKLKAIIETFNDEKVIKDEKKKPKTEQEIAIEKEKKKAKGADYDGDLSPDEDAKDWGELKEGEEETADWNDKSDTEDEASADWNDKSDTEDEEGADWSGLDVGKGNKFNSGRGVGQGDGGDKGYKYDEEDGMNDRTSEGEEEDPHDWNGLDIGRGNKFSSGRGVGQGPGDKGYKYDKDKKGGGKKGGENADELDAGVEVGEGADFEDLEDEGDGNLAMDDELDEILGDPAEDPEWDTGARAFEKITLDITVSRLDSPGSPTLGDVSLLERNGLNLLLDAPASAFKLGERVSFAVVLGNSGDKKKLQLDGQLKTSEPSGEGREIILVTVTEVSQPHLGEIEKVFEQKQAQLLKFLREAKG